jgi:hypothetical protein
MKPFSSLFTRASLCLAITIVATATQAAGPVTLLGTPLLFPALKEALRAMRDEQRIENTQALEALEAIRQLQPMRIKSVHLAQQSTLPMAPRMTLRQQSETDAPPRL